jgi:hypothetical protein
MWKVCKFNPTEKIQLTLGIAVWIRHFETWRMIHPDLQDAILESIRDNICERILATNGKVREPERTQGFTNDEDALL